MYGYETRIAPNVSSQANLSTLLQRASVCSSRIGISTSHYAAYLCTQVERELSSKPRQPHRLRKKEQASDCPFLIWRETTVLVLLAWRSCRFRERPHAILELQNDHAAVLARRPDGAATRVEVQLRRAPVPIVRFPLPESRVIGAHARAGTPGWIEIDDLARMRWVANIEHSVICALLGA